MPDFSQRSDEKELMDEEDISFEEFHDCLIGLERINHLTLAYRPTLQWLRPWVENSERLFVLDVASGGGDMLRQIAKEWPERTAAENGYRMVGVDLNPGLKNLPNHGRHPQPSVIKPRMCLSSSQTNPLI